MTSNTVLTKKYSPSFRLCKFHPSLLDGMAQLLDRDDIDWRYTIQDSDYEADLQALYADWNAVGGDFERSINTISAK